MTMKQACQSISEKFTINTSTCYLQLINKMEYRTPEWIYRSLLHGPIQEHITKSLGNQAEFVHLKYDSMNKHGSNEF